MSETFDKINKWMTPIFVECSEADEPTQALLYRRHDNGELVRSWRFRPPTDRQNLVTIMHQIDAQAQADATGSNRRKPQRYIIALRDDTGAMGSLQLTYRPELTDLDEEETEEQAPSDKLVGAQLVALAMRHAEASQRALVSAMPTVMGAWQGTVELQAKTIEAMAGKWLAAMRAEEQNLSQKHARDLEEKRELAKIERTSGMWERAQMLLPAVASKILGTPPATDEVTRIQMTMAKDFAGSINKGQFETILSALTPEQQITFVQFIQTMAPPTAAPPTNGAAGGNGKPGKGHG